MRLSDSIMVLLVRHNSYMQYYLMSLPVRVPVVLFLCGVLTSNWTCVVFAQVAVLLHNKTIKKETGKGESFPKFY